MSDNFEGLTAGERETIRDIVHNEYYLRREAFAKLSHPKRDLYNDCGYKETSELTAELYMDLYERFPIATRVVDITVDESWRRQPYVYETEDDLEQTPFEKAWADLDRTLNYVQEGQQNWFIDNSGSVVWEYLKRADRLSRIGHYGLLVLEFDDVGNTSGDTQITWADPAPGFSEQDPETFIATNALPDLSASSGVKLLGLRCFDQTKAEVVQWYEDGPMYGRPRMYRITLVDADSVSTDKHVMGVKEREVDVHWSRVIHIADGLTSSEYVGTPAMRPVLNDIHDLRKIYGASGEGYWRMAFPWLSFESHPNLGAKGVINRDELADEVERAKNTLERYMATVGGTWKTIAGEVTDPQPHITERIAAICIYLGCPVRIFMGSERGELASSTDKDAWDERMMMRQQNHITPRIIVPFVNRLITTGVLPAPSEGFQVRWPDLTTLSLQAKATWAVTQVNAIIKYVSGAGDFLISPPDFLVKVLGFSQKEAAEILENTEKHVSESSGEMDVVGRSPSISSLDRGDDVLGDREGSQKEVGAGTQKKVFGDQ